MWPEADRWRAPVGDFPPPWASAWGDDPYGLWAEFTVNGVTQRMRWIEPTGPEGFWMGSNPMVWNSDLHRLDKMEKQIRDWINKTETPSRRMTLSRGFWLADTPCTQSLWQAVVGGDNPSRFKGGIHSAERPVEQVNLGEDLPRFFAALAETIPSHPALPSETQWEWACRAGCATAYAWGDEADLTRGNFAGSKGETTRVRRYPPNKWGLYDMHGNVWEWCADAWRQDPNLPAPQSLEPGSSHVVRGGSWRSPALGVRSTSRNAAHYGDRSGDLGFRLALGCSPKPGGPGA